MICTFIFIHHLIIDGHFYISCLQLNSNRTDFYVFIFCPKRLAQGHARLMFQTQVTVIDAVVVVTLMESSMLSAALISADNALHSTFPEDPMKEYQNQGYLTLIVFFFFLKI